MAVKCLIDNTTHKSVVSLARYLKKLGISNKQYYDRFLKTKLDGVCLNCKLSTVFAKFKYYKFCSVKCSSYYNGKKNCGIIRSDETKQKVSDSWQDRSPDWINKRKETIEQKYGMSYIDHKRKLWKDRFDKMVPEEITEFYDNCVSKQGFSKSRKFKDYQLGNRSVLVQGYEPFVLDVLLDYYHPEHIIVGRSKERMVKYVDEKGKIRRYFGDIFLPDNVLIEVKSTYTLEKNYLNTLLKLKASYEAGYKPILIVWNNKMPQMEMCKKELIETISSQAWNCTGRFNDYPFIGVGCKQMAFEALGIQQ